MTEQAVLNILYFEDDIANAQLIGDYLKQHQHQVFHFPEYPQGGISHIRDIMPVAPDVVIMDVNMPQMNGYELCQLLRRELLSDHCGVIFTSGLMSDEDIMRAYEAGADDYLIKPYDFEELTARIESVLRRSHLSIDEEICFKVGNIQLFPTTHRILKAGKNIELSQKEWAILEPMMMYPNQIFSKQVLEEKLYDWQTEINSNTIEVHVHNLRQKLGKDLIRTVRGLGYCIETHAK